MLLDPATKIVVPGGVGTRVGTHPPVAVGEGVAVGVGVDVGVEV
jgi:hypothetical protein